MTRLRPSGPACGICGTPGPHTRFVAIPDRITVGEAEIFAATKQRPPFTRWPLCPGCSIQGVAQMSRLEVAGLVSGHPVDRVLADALDGRERHAYGAYEALAATFQGALFHHERAGARPDAPATNDRPWAHCRAALATAIGDVERRAAAVTVTCPDPLGCGLCRRTSSPAAVAWHTDVYGAAWLCSECYSAASEAEQLGRPFTALAVAVSEWLKPEVETGSQVVESWKLYPPQVRPAGPADRFPWISRAALVAAIRAERLGATSGPVRPSVTREMSTA